MNPQDVVFDMADGSKITVPVGPPTVTPGPPIAPPPVVMPPVVVPPPAGAGRWPALPDGLFERVGVIVDDDPFMGPEKWGTVFSDSWFGRERFNNQQLDASLISFLNPGVHLGVNGAIGCLINSNPANPNKPGLTFSAGIWQVRARVGAGGWPTIWTDGQRSWPNDGEIDVLEKGNTSNYHSGGPTQDGTDHADNFSFARSYADGAFHDIALVRTADLKEPGASGHNYIVVDQELVHDYPTYDRLAAHYLIFSVGNPNGGGGDMTIERSTLWTLV